MLVPLKVTSFFFFNCRMSQGIREIILEDDFLALTLFIQMRSSALLMWRESEGAVETIEARWGNRWPD